VRWREKPADLRGKIYESDDFGKTEKSKTERSAACFFLSACDCACLDLQTFPQKYVAFM
jgi:hypothetical protein